LFLATVSNEKARTYRHIYEYILNDIAKTAHPEPRIWKFKVLTAETLMAYLCAEIDQGISMPGTRIFQLCMQTVQQHCFINMVNIYKKVAPVLN
jgi:hypothetical protein